MPRGKTKSVLQTKLGTRIAAVLLRNRDGMNGYQIAKEVYAGKTLMSPKKVYETLSRMGEEGIVYTTSKKIGKKKFNLHILNPVAVVRVFSLLKLPPDKQLTEKEIKEEAQVLPSIRFFIDAIIKPANTFNFLDYYAAAYYAMALKKSKAIPASYRDKFLYLKVPKILRQLSEVLSGLESG